MNSSKKLALADKISVRPQFQWKSIYIELAGDSFHVSNKERAQLESSVLNKVCDQIAKGGISILDETLANKNGTTYSTAEFAEDVRCCLGSVQLELVVEKVGKTLTTVAIETDDQRRMALLACLETPKILKRIIGNKMLPELRFANDAKSDRKNIRVLGPSDFPLKQSKSSRAERLKTFFQFMEQNHPEQLHCFKMILKEFLFGRMKADLVLFAHILFGPNAGGKGTFIRMLDSVDWCRKAHSVSASHFGPEYSSDAVFKAEGSLCVVNEYDISRPPSRNAAQMLKSGLRREPQSTRRTGSGTIIIKPSHGFVFMINPTQSADRDAAVDEISKHLAEYDATDRFNLCYVDWRKSSEGESLGNQIDAWLSDFAARVDIAHELYEFGLLLEHADFKPVSIDEKYRDFRAARSAPKLTKLLEGICHGFLSAYERLMSVSNCDESDAPRELEPHEKAVILRDSIKPFCGRYVDGMEIHLIVETGELVAFGIASSIFTPMIKDLAEETQKWAVPHHLLGAVDKTGARYFGTRIVRFDIEQIQQWQDKLHDEDVMPKYSS